MTFYHLHYTELRIELMKHRHRISSFVVFILRNKKCFVNILLYKKFFILLVKPAKIMAAYSKKFRMTCVRKRNMTKLK